MEERVNPKYILGVWEHGNINVLGTAWGEDELERKIKLLVGDSPSLAQRLMILAPLEYVSIKFEPEIEICGINPPAASP